METVKYKDENIVITKATFGGYNAACQMEHEPGTGGEASIRYSQLPIHFGLTKVEAIKAMEEEIDRYKGGEFKFFPKSIVDVSDKEIKSGKFFTGSHKRRVMMLGHDSKRPEGGYPKPPTSSKIDVDCRKNLKTSEILKAANDYLGVPRADVHEPTLPNPYNTRGRK